MAQTPDISEEESSRERTPEEIRRDIDGTRADMDLTLDEIEDRVSPSRIRERQVNRINSRWQRVRTSVMGSDKGDADSSSRVRDRAQGTTDSVRQAPDAALGRASGNPLAAGLIAFGLGALAGSLFPASRPEQQAAQHLRDRFEEPIKNEARRVGEEASESLKPSAQKAVEETKQSAQYAAQRTKEEAQSSAQDLREETTPST